MRTHGSDIPEFRQVVPVGAAFGVFGQVGPVVLTAVEHWSTAMVLRFAAPVADQYSFLSGNGFMFVADLELHLQDRSGHVWDLVSKERLVYGELAGPIFCEASVYIEPPPDVSTVTGLTVELRDPVTGSSRSATVDI